MIKVTTTFFDYNKSVSKLKKTKKEFISDMKKLYGNCEFYITNKKGITTIRFDNYFLQDHFVAEHILEED